MLAVLPHKEFELLMKGVSEDSSSYKFSYKDMTADHANTYSDVLQYVGNSDCRYVGSGSSRTAFYIPPGSVNKDKTIPSCLKVAKNKPGIAQNDVEIQVYNKYGKSTVCIPEVFDYDKRNKFYMLTEVGEGVENDTEIETYFEDWNDSVSNFKIRNCEDIVYALKSYTRDSAVKQALKKEIYEIVKDYPKYSTIISLLEFVEKDMGHIVIGDFGQRANWAFIVRNGVKCLLPIDFGFSQDVKDQYYTGHQSWRKAENIKKAATKKATINKIFPSQKSTDSSSIKTVKA